MNKKIMLLLVLCTSMMTATPEKINQKLIEFFLTFELYINEGINEDALYTIIIGYLKDKSVHEKMKFYRDLNHIFSSHSDPVEHQIKKKIIGNTFSLSKNELKFISTLSPESKKGFKDLLNSCNELFERESAPKSLVKALLMLTTPDQFVRIKTELRPKVKPQICIIDNNYRDPEQTEGLDLLNTVCLTQEIIKNWEQYKCADRQVNALKNQIKQEEEWLSDADEIESNLMAVDKMNLVMQEFVDPALKQLEDKKSTVEQKLIEDFLLLPNMQRFSDELQAAVQLAKEQIREKSDYRVRQFEQLSTKHRMLSDKLAFIDEKIKRKNAKKERVIAQIAQVETALQKMPEQLQRTQIATKAVAKINLEQALNEGKFIVPK